ncbi:hypothetical protein JZ751_018758 [Albula glossodonta]|uniref:Fibronectin type-III domain-containing protein n=1 Tax=Albula glossodonta TaxID=121402 RepID=A0A8T2NNP9_9TELE|nr:hypothetical protein JZ751_018758 [Albula glossodonta]
MLCPAMMTDQPPPPLEVTPMLAEVSLVPHMLNGDAMQQPKHIVGLFSLVPPAEEMTSQHAISFNCLRCGRVCALVQAAHGCFLQPLPGSPPPPLALALDLAADPRDGSGFGGRAPHSSHSSIPLTLPMILIQVNPGETFTIRTEDGQICCIAGPAHVPMVSPNGTMPPIFVPPGYMSQVVEENGMRKVVVLPHAAEFHPSMTLPPPPVPPYLPPHPAMLHHHIYPGEIPPHFIPPLPPPQVYSEPGEDERAAKMQDQLRRRVKDRQLSAGVASSVRISHSPPLPPATAAATLHNGHSKGPTAPSAASPGPCKHKPSVRPRASPPSDPEKPDAEAEMRMLELLSSVRKPTVSLSVRLSVCLSVSMKFCLPPSLNVHLSLSPFFCHFLLVSLSLCLPFFDSLPVCQFVCSVAPRSAVLSWQQPSLPLKNGDAPPPHTPLPFCYELSLSRSGSEGNFTPVYLGKDTSFTVQDLRPATDYHVRVCVSCSSVQGSPSEVTSFTTENAAPDAPSPPWLTLRTKNSLSLQWKAPSDNGSKITGYLLEYDEGKQSAFKEVYCGHAKQYKVIRLTPSTKYAFRIAAKNSIGMSKENHTARSASFLGAVVKDDSVLEHFDVATPSALDRMWEALTAAYYFPVSGCAPAPPAPPRLAGAGVSWLALEWSAPCGPASDGAYTYTLEMEEEGSGYGFKPKHNGEELSCTVKSLRKSSSYRFRVLAANGEGRSQPSAAVDFSTCPDRPSAPATPALKGKALPHSLHVSWGSQWEAVYSGPLREHVCDRLEPGTLYKMRVHCQSKGGQSQPCPHLLPEPPTQDGGAPVSQYAVEMGESADGPRCPLYQGAETDCAATDLLPGHSYHFWVKAANQAGWGLFSEVYEAFTAPGPPEQCGPPELTVKTANSVLASWEVPACNGAEVSEFRLEWGAAEGSMTLMYCGPSPSYEVRGLVPATAYYCRVQAVNVAGAGLFGDVAMVTTSPSVPAAVRLVEEVGEETLPDTLPGPASSCLALRWEEPCCHGAEIIGYNIDFGEQVPLSVGRTNYYVLENLQPDSTYRVRVQAVNSVGAGAFSPVLKAKTRPLPPDPPALECAVPGPQSLKLKWGEGPSRPQLSGATQYCLHMQASAERLVCIYSGPCHTFKVQRLSEATLYHFSIQAHNEAGVGPLSPLYSFSTTRSPPPQLKAPRVELLDWNQYEVTWEPLQPMRGDPILYTLQLLRGREVEQLYKGSSPLYTWQGTSAGGDWRVRVSAGRQCQDGTELWGQHSPSVTLPAPDPTLGPAPGEPGATPANGAHPRKGGALTDEQFALLLLLGFATVAILFAVVIQYFVIK